MTEFTSSDALQRRIASFIRQQASISRSINGENENFLGTWIGAVRKENQDRAIIASVAYANSPERSFVLGIICDGMGGLIKGDEAATIAISAFVSRVVRTARLPILDRLRSAAMFANKAVYETLNARGGTTLSAVVISATGGAAVVNVGDSRVYGLKNASNIKQISTDDTLAAFLEKKGIGSSTRDGLIQFVGMGEGLVPHVFPLKSEEFSSFVLTTDGIHDGPADAFAQVFRREATGREILGRLIAFSEALGGWDNGTAVLLSGAPTRIYPSYDLGLTLRILSPVDSLEIWIPLAEQNRQEDLPLELPEQRSTEAPRQTEVSRKKKRTTVKTSAKKKKKSEFTVSSKGAPGQSYPRLKIGFPARRRRQP